MLARLLESWKMTGAMPAAVEVVSSSEAGVLGAIDVLSELGAREVELRGEMTVLAWFDRAIVLAELRAALEARGAGVERIRELPFETVDQGAIWGGRLRPIRVGPLAISTTGPAEPGTLSLEVGSAFGSGLHPTTAMCLERIVARCPIDSLLDAGCGTGILALSALALGSKRAVATDVDPRALELTRANALRNQLADRLETSAQLPNAQFAVVAANILGATLIALASDLVRCLAPRSALILSGIRAAELEEVARVYQHLGLRRVGHEARGDWCCLDLEPSW